MKSSQRVPSRVESHLSSGTDTEDEISVGRDIKSTKWRRVSETLPITAAPSDGQRRSRKSQVCIATILDRFYGDDSFTGTMYRSDLNLKALRAVYLYTFGSFFLYIYLYHAYRVMSSNMCTLLQHWKLFKFAPPICFSVSFAHLRGTGSAVVRARAARPPAKAFRPRGPPPHTASGHRTGSAPGSCSGQHG